VAAGGRAVFRDGDGDGKSSRVVRSKLDGLAPIGRMFSASDGLRVPESACHGDGDDVMLKRGWVAGNDAVDGYADYGSSGWQRVQACSSNDPENTLQY
jgi:hypothetical protein